MKTCMILMALTAGLTLAADATAGKGVYDKSCKKCHGADGTAVAAIAKLMKVEMKHLGSKEVQAKNDAALKKVVTEGTGKMKGIALPAGDADNLLSFVRTLKQ